ncbi:MAG: helix-turn-helix domain-containing protein [Woeseia sp.]
MGAHAVTSTIDYGDFRRECGFCSLNELCWPTGVEPSDLEHLQSMVRHARPLPAGSYLYRVGDPFTAVYAVREGCIKSYTLDAGGHELVHGFHLRGEPLGFDAVFPDRHRCNALILETASVCVIPYQDIARLSVEFHNLQYQLLRLMSREFSRRPMFAEGFGATQRTARFLMDMRSRLRQPGGPEYEFRLPMSREDISNYLGITSETLSRLFAKMHRKELIDVDRRRIRLVDPVRLDLIARGIRLAEKSACS